MLCPGCGSELPDAAPSCPQCRKKFSIDAPEPISMDTASQERDVRKLLLVTFLILSLGGAGGWYAWSGLRRRADPSAGVAAGGTKGVRIRQPIVSSSSTIRLGGNRFVSFPLYVPPDSHDPAVDVDFSVNGGASTVEALVLDEKGLASWKSTGTAHAAYRSGRLGQLTAKTPLPQSTNPRFFLIVHNSSSAPQRVKIAATLEYGAGNQ